MAQNYLSRRPEFLTSWKEIASFMGKGVRTVQRWEVTLGLPVIRPADSRLGIVMARPRELEAWLVNGRQGSHHDWDSQRKKDDEARAALSECVREMRSCHAEVRALCDQMNATRKTLEHEIDRLKFLYSEWNAINGRALSEKKTAWLGKVN